VVSETEWSGHAACMREMRNAYKILVGEPVDKSLIVGYGVVGNIPSTERPQGLRRYSKH